MEELNDGGHRRFKDELYEEFARVGKALANPKRLEILDLLAQRERSVQGLAEEMAVSVANASQHLQTLLDARLVEAREEGTYRYYRPAGDDVLGLWRALRDVGHERLAEVDAIVERYLGARTARTAEDPARAIERAQADEVALVDVRPAAEYEEAHLPEARSAPIDELDDHIEHLPEEIPLLVYCRGPFCVYSDQAVQRLRAEGFEAERLDPGLSDWRALGAPLRSSQEVDA